MADLKQKTSLESRNMCLKKDKRRQRRALLKSHFGEYINTLQGLRYVTDRKLSLVEKIFWLSIYLACIGMSFYCIMSVWEKWQNNPVVVAFNEQLEPAWSVPFPSVTICPQMIISTKKFNYGDTYIKHMSLNTRYMENTNDTHTLKQETFLESGNMCLKKDKRIQRRVLLKSHFGEYINTLQGLRYVTDRKLSLVEKIFWLIIYLACIGISCYCIMSVWEKWQNNPVIVAFNEQLEPAWSVPFPSVTICPQLKISTEKFNYTAARKKYLNKLSGEYSNDTDISEVDIRLVKHFSRICKDEEKISKTITQNYFNSLLVQDLSENAPYTSDIFFNSIYWHGKRKGFYQFFKKVLTEEGICYNMNSLPVDEILQVNSVQNEFEYMAKKNWDKIRGWTVDGYFDPYVQDPYPRRGSGSSINLRMAFGYRSDYQDEICNGINTGYKVYLHQPEDMPRTTTSFYSVPLNRESSFALKFNVIKSLDNIRSASPNARQCFFSTERQLRYFKIYTESNCELECLTNRTFELCQCVFFYMPHHTSDMICAQNCKKCVDIVHDSIQNKTCDCLPSCNSVEYEAEVINADYNLKEYYNALSKSSGRKIDSVHEQQYSALHMYYKYPRFLSMRRSQLFGITDFLANSGGLLGLFLGFSSLSLVEMIYYISLRLWCILKKDDKELKDEEKGEL